MSESSAMRSGRAAGVGTLVVVLAIALLMMAPSSAARSAASSGAKDPGASLNGYSGAVGLVAHTNVVVQSHLSVKPGTTPSCLPTQMCPAFVLDAYNMTAIASDSGFNGTNQAIGIVDACGDPNIASDLATFDTAWGLTAPPVLSVYQPDGSVCTNTGWEVETALDVEWAHVMAPGAAIDLIETATTGSADLYAAWNYGWNNTPAFVFSNSWSASVGCGAALNDQTTWLSHAGATILAATGDSGSWGYQTNGASVQSPADCPRVTGVGGTTLVVSSTGAYMSEGGWVGSGGGYGGASEPSWQAHVYIPNPTSSPVLIGKPDVSATANPSRGVLVYDSGNGGWLLVGGTSVATPIWSGFLVDVQSWRANYLLYPALGGINSYLYQTIYGAFGHGYAYNHGAMHDIQTGNNAHLTHGNWKALVGWDPVTGIGSFDGYNLDYALANDYSA